MAKPSSPAAAARVRGSPATRTTDYGAPASPDWRAVDWRAHLHQVEVDGTPVNYVDIGDGRRASRWCSSTVSAASGRTGSRTSRALAQERRVIALDLPGFGCSQMPRERDLDLRLRPGGRRALRAARAGRVAWSATRWAASSPRRWRSSSRSGSSGWCWSRRRHLHRRHPRSAPIADGRARDRRPSIATHGGCAAAHRRRPPARAALAPALGGAPSQPR